MQIECTPGPPTGATTAISNRHLESENEEEDVQEEKEALHRSRKFAGGTPAFGAPFPREEKEDQEEQEKGEDEDMYSVDDDDMTHAHVLSKSGQDSGGTVECAPIHHSEIRNSEARLSANHPDHNSHNDSLTAQTHNPETRDYDTVRTSGGSERSGVLESSAFPGVRRPSRISWQVEECDDLEERGRGGEEADAGGGGGWTGDEEKGGGEGKEEEEEEMPRGASPVAYLVCVWERVCVCDCACYFLHRFKNSTPPSTYTHAHTRRKRGKERGSCFSLRIFVRMCVFMYVFVRVCVCVCARARARARLCVCVCVRARTQTQTRKRTFES